MEIKTKYDIGQRIWIVYKADGEISMYIDTIAEISYSENLGVVYFPDICQEELKENEIILEEDIDKLLKEILKLQREIDSNDN